MTLQKMMEHFFRLYGRRNRVYLTSLRIRIDFLNLAIRDLKEAVRKRSERKAIETALARSVSRVFCIAEHFYNLPVIPCLCRKYPKEQCAYCFSFPCACREKRPPALLAEKATDEQMQWSLRDWCAHFDALYGAKNRKTGFDVILARLFQEISELSSLEMRVLAVSWSMDAIEEEFSLELADTLAWIIAAANFLCIDLERAVLDRFGSGCWSCKQNPCVCGRFNMAPVNWEPGTWDIPNETGTPR